MGTKPLSVQARALWRAADILGGKDRLRAALRVPMARLEEWLAGAAQPPMHVFLKAVDIISTPAGRATPAAAASRLALRLPPAVTRFLETPFGEHELPAMLESALDAAIDAGRGQMGNVQLLREGGLRIVAKRGFKEPFLRFFDIVRDTHCACGSALKGGGRVVVSDVAAHPIFKGTEAAKVMEAAGARAVQSTPLVSSAGRVLGVVSVHYDHPYTPPASDLAVIDQIARRAAYWLEQPTA